MPGFAWWKEKPQSCQEHGISGGVVGAGVPLVFESGRPIAHVAADLGVPSVTLRKHARQVEANEGRRADLLTSEERAEIRKLRREVFELRRGNERLNAAVCFSRPSSIHTVRSERVHR
jgi:transposase